MLLKKFLDGFVFLAGAENVFVHACVWDQSEVMNWKCDHYRMSHVYNEHTMLWVSILVSRWCETKTLFFCLKVPVGQVSGRRWESMLLQLTTSHFQFQTLWFTPAVSKNAPLVCSRTAHDSEHLWQINEWSRTVYAWCVRLALTLSCPWKPLWSHIFNLGVNYVIFLAFKWFYHCSKVISPYYFVSCTVTLEKN